MSYCTCLASDRELPEKPHPEFRRVKIVND